MDTLGEYQPGLTVLCFALWFPKFSQLWTSFDQDGALSQRER